MVARAGIALGSNLGDRLAHLRAAMSALRDLAAPGEPVLSAAVYQSAPCDCPPGSPDFFNTVIEIAFAGDAHTLLAQARALEQALGRVRTADRNAPRVIDIDLLYLGAARCDDPLLVLPHPRLGQRRFVLQPLAEIRPELVLPGLALTIAELLDRMPQGVQPLRRVAAAL